MNTIAKQTKRIREVIKERDQFDTLIGLKLGIIDHIPKDAFAEATLVNTGRQFNQGDNR